MNQIKYRNEFLNTPNKVNSDDFNLNTFAIYLFEKLKESISKQPIFSEKIPFAYIWSFFSFYKINKKDAKKVVRIWVELGLCDYVRFRGIKIKRW